MKKLIAVLVFCFVAVTGVMAQKTTSRIPLAGGTGGQLTYNYKAYTVPTATARKIVPNASTTIVRDTLNASRTDSLVTAFAYAGDRLTIIYANRAVISTVTFAGAFAGAAGGFAPSGCVTNLASNQLVIAASKTAVATFIFNGYTWVMLSVSNNI